MSWALWNKLPHGFLKRGYKNFDKLDHRVKALIVDLATQQNFRCALCSRDRHLIVEHDHNPFQGTGNVPTIYNIRGLTCQRCNWHLMMYEHSDYVFFGEASSNISSQEWDEYIYGYDCRVVALHESELEERCPNYWQRRLFLNKFDDWSEWGNRRREYPWRWYFGEIKDQKYGKIRTTAQFLKMLAAVNQFLKNELEKDPNYEPPDELVKALFRIKPFLDELRPTVEARLAEIRKSKEAFAGSAAIASA
jgi:hypothetical protein